MIGYELKVKSKTVKMDVQKKRQWKWNLAISLTKFSSTCKLSINLSLKCVLMTSPYLTLFPSHEAILSLCEAFMISPKIINISPTQLTFSWFLLAVYVVSIDDCRSYSSSRFSIRKLGSSKPNLGSCYYEVCWHLYELINGLVDVLTI